MADFASEMELLQLAVRNVEQLQEVIHVVEKKLVSVQEGAQVLARPCAVLDLKLLEAQARVEELIQRLHGAAIIGAETKTGRRLFGRPWRASEVSR